MPVVWGTRIPSPGALPLRRSHRTPQQGGLVRRKFFSSHRCFGFTSFRAAAIATTPQPELGPRPALASCMGRGAVLPPAWLGGAQGTHGLGGDAKSAPSRPRKQRAEGVPMLHQRSRTARSFSLREGEQYCIDCSLVQVNLSIMHVSEDVHSKERQAHEASSCNVGLCSALLGGCSLFLGLLLRNTRTRRHERRKADTDAHRAAQLTLSQSLAHISKRGGARTSASMQRCRHVAQGGRQGGSKDRGADLELLGHL